MNYESVDNITLGDVSRILRNFRIELSIAAVEALLLKTRLRHRPDLIHEAKRDSCAEDPFEVSMRYFSWPLPRRYWGTPLAGIHQKLHQLASVKQQRLGLEVVERLQVQPRRGYSPRMSF